MNGKQAIQAALVGTKYLLDWFVQDLSDADLFVRPAPGANHIAWQLGNVIAGDRLLVMEQLPNASYPTLPAGFVETHGSGGAHKNGPADFLSKSEYVALFDTMRSATIDTLGTLTDADLDRPATGKIAAFAPTLGHVFLLVSNHTLMHTGQFTVVRRLLGKPVLF